MLTGTHTVQYNVHCMESVHAYGVLSRQLTNASLYLRHVEKQEKRQERKVATGHTGFDSWALISDWCYSGLSDVDSGKYD